MISLKELMRTIQSEKSFVVNLFTMFPLLHLLIHLIVLVGLVIHTLLSLLLNFLAWSLVMGWWSLRAGCSLKRIFFLVLKDWETIETYFLVMTLICIQYFETWISFWFIALQKTTGKWLFGCSRYLHENTSYPLPPRIQSSGSTTDM